MRSHDDDAPYPLVAAPSHPRGDVERENERRERAREEHRASGKPAGTRWTRENRRKGRQIEREVPRHVEKGVRKGRRRRRRRYNEGSRNDRNAEGETERRGGRGNDTGPRRIAVYNA